MKIEIIVTTSFEGFHCWPDAPQEVGFLRNEHRHVFVVKSTFLVAHQDRSLEFFVVRRQIDEQICAIKTDMPVGTWSCEMWAIELLNRFPSMNACEVWEDDENGARVTR